MLYKYEACPFCVKVRRAMKLHALNIETRDVKRSDTDRKDLGAPTFRVQIVNDQ